MRRGVDFMMLCMCLTAAAGARAAEKTIRLPDAGELKLALPDGWSADTDGATPPTVTAHGDAARHVSVQMTPMPTHGKKPSDADVKRSVVSTAAAQFASGSVEKKAVPMPVKGDHVKGWICSFTDASADPGEFRCVSSGIVMIDAQGFVLTILSDKKDGPVHDAGLALVESASFVHAAKDAPAAAANAAALKVNSPDEKWSVSIPGQWQVAGLQSSAKQVELNASDSDHGWILSVFIEPAARAGDARVARNVYLSRMKRNPVPMTHLKQAEIGDMAYLEYDQDVNHNFNAYLSQDGYWVDVHVSKAEFDPAKDKAGLDAMLNGIKVVTSK